MKRFLAIQKLCLIVLAAFAIQACKESIDTSARYVFKYDSVLSYLQKHEAYAEYVKLLEVVPVSYLSESTVAQLLSARGHYTVFAPTNEAIEAYLQEVYEDNPDLMSGPTWNDFFTEHKRDSIRKVIVYNSIIDSGDNVDYFQTHDFPETNGGEFQLSNMMDRKMSVRYAGVDSIYINGDCPLSVTERDILCLNGVIHQVGKAIAPKDITMFSYMQDMLDHDREGFLVAAKVIQACGLFDTLSKIRDEAYENLYLRGLIEDLPNMVAAGFAEGSIGYAPRHRNYGFTLFAETDDFWRSQGLNPHSPSSELLPNLMNWLVSNEQYSKTYDTFTTDENYKSPDNLINQWITYHLLPLRLSPDRLVFHRTEYGYTYSNPYNYGVPVCDYYATMGKRRLLKLYESKESNGIYLNRCANYDNGRRGTGHEISCDEDKVGCKVLAEDSLAVTSELINGCIYPIDTPLSYNDQTRFNLGRTRIRFDGMSMMPEAMTNDIRLLKTREERYFHVYIPRTSIYNYFENMRQNDQMFFVYYSAYQDAWCNLNSDEMKGVGRYEIQFKLPPVPIRTTYELRYDVLANGKRGVGQLYFGSDPDNLPVTGIPLDLTLPARYSQFGFEADTEDDDYNAEVDKRMRNNGVMKGALSVCQNGVTSQNERINNNYENVRRIVWRGTVDPDKTYYLRIKSVLDNDKREFYMDYLELCPKEVYDNPETPEDIW
ncbi:MAG: fasciclin domain-containing protein [Bacteroidaceae bacterium]|nr:fasciclin domain-containing protein [Bacteroidaceae bacterium]